VASQTEIVNFALTLLGENRITSIDDDVKAARDMKAVYALCRDNLLGAHTWSFAKKRAQLTALSEVPAFQYARKFQIPTDALRLVMVGEFYAGVSLADYSNMPSSEFTIEGKQILTDYAAPLNLVYIRRMDDPTQFHPCFVLTFAAYLAYTTAETITNSGSKRDRAERAYNRELSSAVRANAIELPPEKHADDEWLLSRL